MHIYFRTQLLCTAPNTEFMKQEFDIFNILKIDILQWDKGQT